MNLQKFQRVCEKSGFQPISKKGFRHGHILLAERYFNTHREMKEPHWQVLWAIERDDLDIAQRIFITGREDGYLTPLGIPADVRKNTGLLVARSWMEDGVESGRYA